MSNPAVEPEIEVANRIAAALPVDAVIGTSLFYGPPRPPLGNIPHKSTWCFASGGPQAQPYLGASADFREFWVQVTHRSNVDDYSGGLSISRAIWSALQRATPVGSGYIAIYVKEAYPTYLGLDDVEHHSWSLNVRLWYKG